MSMENGKQEPPIKYPTITVPGKGTYLVKFGLGAAYTLEEECGLNELDFARAIQKWMPHKEHVSGCEAKQCDCPEIPGQVSKTFLFKVLSACIWDQAQLTPRQLADAFDTWDCLGDVVRVIGEAFAKIKWSARPVALQESATPATTERGAAVN